MKVMTVETVASRIFKQYLPLCLAFTSIVLTSVCSAAEGVSFFHKDWELVCDNTRTCRMAGYYPEEREEGTGEDPLPFSVLLVREAGPGTPVKGSLMIGEYEEIPEIRNLPAIFKLKMQVNEKLVGEITVKHESLTADFSPAQIAALLAALPGNASIQFMYEDIRWHLSNKGAAAALLKMDEFQGRLNTVGALIKKGNQNESKVLPPLPAPTIVKAPIVKTESTDEALVESKPLRQALFAMVSNEECYEMKELGVDEMQIIVNRLSKTKLLVSSPCWRAAYNAGTAYWVINQAPPFAPVLVTTQASDYADGEISASQKGRGLGDCWSMESWVWDGKQFVYASQKSTGACRLIAPGGAWELPTFVSNAVAAEAKKP